MKSYYINLDTASGRREHMESEARRCGLNMVRVAAVNGRQHSVEDLRAICSGPEGMLQMSAPEIACFLSHKQAWAQIAAGADAYGAVFEDDVLFAADASQWLGAEQWIPESADIIKLETVAKPVLLHGPPTSAGGGRGLWRLAGLHLGAGGYILSRSCAQALLQHTATFRGAADSVLFHPQCGFFTEHVVLQLSPALCVQQVRTRQRFLPAEAEVSMLQKVRGGRMRPGPRKAIREIGRFVMRGARAIRLGTWAKLNGGRYGRVPFR